MWGSLSAHIRKEELKPDCELLYLFSAKKLSHLKVWRTVIIFNLDVFLANYYFIDAVPTESEIITKNSQ